MGQSKRSSHRDREQPSGSRNKPINLVREDLDVELGHKKSHSVSRNSTRGSLAADDFRGQVASEAQVQAMIQNIAALAKNEKPDPIRRDSSARSRRSKSASRKSETKRRSSSGNRATEDPPSTRRSSSSQRHVRSSSRPSETERRSSSRNRSSPSRSRQERSSSRKRESTKEVATTERRASPSSSSRHRRSSSHKPDQDVRRSRSRSPSRSKSQRNLHRSNSAHNVKKDPVPIKKEASKKKPTKIVDQVPKIPDIDKQDQPPRKKNWPLFCFLMMLLIIPALVFIYFFLFAPKKEPIVVSPTIPTRSPTPAPTIATPNPTQEPTERDATRSPSSTPTMVPTPSPSEFLEGPINAFLKEHNVDVFNTTNPAVKKAAAWLYDEAYFANGIPFRLDQKYLNRFAILAFYFSVFDKPSTATYAPVPGRDFDGNTGNGGGDGDGEDDDDDTISTQYIHAAQLGEITLPNWGMRTQDECFWRGMVCDANGLITEIRFPKKNLKGTIPTEIGLLSNLRLMDLSRNQLEGSIPDELYDNLDLQKLYLYKNQLTGTISSKIGELWDLTDFNVAQNKLSGSLPNRLASRSLIRQFRYFNVNRNQLTGTIPENLRWRQVFYVDLGNNKFSGTLPADLGVDFVRLRHLFLDHNKFTGTVPQSYIWAGDGRIQSLVLNDNLLRGSFPGNHQVYTQLTQLLIQNNNFDSMSKDSCKLDVFVGGELIEFKAQCKICKCGDDSVMCRFCV